GQSHCSVPTLMIDVGIRPQVFVNVNLDPGTRTSRQGSTRGGDLRPEQTRTAFHAWEGRVTNVDLSGRARAGCVALCFGGMSWIFWRRRVVTHFHRSAGEHDLASRSGLEDLLVRARYLDQWQFAANNGTQSPIFQASKQARMDVRLFFRCNTPERECTNRRAAPHQLTRIDGNLTATA